jgi:superfamily I DNA/RNA helicase
MSRIIVINGPPGTGKTTKLTEMFESAVRHYGAHRVAAVTYTRAAARELQVRAATALGLSSRLPRDLQRELPYVGTIHSLAYRAIGHPQMVDRRSIGEFFLERVPGMFTKLPDLGEEGMPEFPENSAEQFLSAISVARHKRRDVLEYLAKVPVLDFDPDNAEYRDYREPYQKYVEWKRDTSLMDFEDLLEQTPRTLPEVRVLFVDEAQDCSALMLHLLVDWARPLEFSAFAGDPFQALYTWAGADPHLLMHLGTAVGGPKTLSISHRLPPNAASYAVDVLESAGWDEPAWMGTWHGSSAPKRLDGTAFYLARTRNLLNFIRGDLYRAGTPFRELRGRGPLETWAADAYRVLNEVQRGELVPREAIQVIAKGVPSRSLYRGVKAELERQHGGELIGRRQIEQLTRESLELTMDRVTHSDYYRLMVATHGPQSLYHTPQLAIGTVHAAKGAEADHVRLLANWGTIPYTATGTPEGAKSEACVAYVGATRHREKFDLVDLNAPGGLYPWP